MSLKHMRKEIGHMKIIEGLYFCKWVTNNTQECKNRKEVLIINPELLLQMNHPEWNKWMNQIPFIFLLNTEHNIIFGNEASWTCALGIMVPFICLISEVKRIYK